MTWWQTLSTQRFGLLLLYVPTVWLVATLLGNALTYQLIGGNANLAWHVMNALTGTIAGGWFAWLWWPLLATSRKMLASSLLAAGLLAIGALVMAEESRHSSMAAYLSITLMVWFCTADHGQTAAGVPCPTCGYDMQGQTDCRCPECGERFTIGDLRLR